MGRGARGAGAPAATGARPGPVHPGVQAGPLAGEDERRLAERAAAGCEAARERLILAHLGLVVAVARRYQNCGLPMDDLVAEGTAGLARAVDRFDPARGARLAAYAPHWIRLAIREALGRSAHAIRVPDHMARLLARWRRAEHRLARQIGGPPAPEAVAGSLGLGPRKMALVRDALAARRLRSAAARAPGDDPIDACPDMGRDEPLGRLIRSEELDGLRLRLGCLEAHERLVLALRFGLDENEPRSLAEIGRRMGLSGEWVRKTEARALGRLARWIDPHGPVGRPG